MPDQTPRRRGSADPAKAVRVWGLASITMPVGAASPTGYVKVEFGHERLAKNDTQAELDRVEELVHEHNVRIVEKRLREFIRLKKAIEVQESQPVRKRARQ